MYNLKLKKSNIWINQYFYCRRSSLKSYMNIILNEQKDLGGSLPEPFFNLDRYPTQYVYHIRKHSYLNTINRCSDPYGTYLLFVFLIIINILRLKSFTKQTKRNSDISSFTIEQFFHLAINNLSKFSKIKMN